MIAAAFDDEEDQSQELISQNLDKIPKNEIVNNNIQNHVETNQNEQKPDQQENQIQIKFMSKKQREELKNKKEQEDKKQEKKKMRQIEKTREEYEKFKYKEWKRKQEKEERRLKKKQEEEKREKRRRRSMSNSQSKSRSRSRSNSQEKVDYLNTSSRTRVYISTDGKMNKEDLAIKMQYLGLKQDIKKQIKPSEKFKNNFNFSWDKSDDTSKDFNPLYEHRLQSSLLFGRGIQAGYDISEQKSHSVNYERLVHKYDPNYQQKSDKKTEEKERDKKRRDIYDLGEGDHWSKKKSEQMTERDWRIFREDNQIVIKGGRVPKPMREWKEFNLPQFILDAIHRQKYKTPTPIQMQAIPIGMERKDLIGIAQTGSGKTAAYLIPLICYLRSLPPIDYERASEGPYALILLPARELAPQVEQEFKNLTINLNLRSYVVIGGRSQEEQMFQIQKGCEVVIGTTGRIKQAIQEKSLVLEQCSWVVLDEADKMIDMGFETDVNYILDSIKSQMKDQNEELAELQEKQSKHGSNVFRVTHLFSATFPAEIERLSKKYMRSFCYISIGEQGGGKKDIDQQVEFLGEHSKKSRLQVILKDFEAPIIIFVNEKNGVELLVKIVEKWGLKAVAYHGSKTQSQREAAVEGFKTKKYDVLIATDLAGRGLHVEGVTLVVNFDAPKNIRDFVHRTGRTGRAGKKGTAVTFITGKDEGLFFDLNDYLIKNNYYVPPELATHEATRQKPGTFENVPRRKQVVLAQ